VVTCSACGVEEEEAPVTWTMVSERAVAGRRTDYYCESCSREHLRSIEAGLDRRYW